MIVLTNAATFSLDKAIAYPVFEGKGPVRFVLEEIQYTSMCPINASSVVFELCQPQKQKEELTS